MARQTVRLDGATYKVYYAPRTDARPWQVTSRPTQRGEVGGYAVAEWDLNNVVCESIEDTAGSGMGCLGIDYTDNADARWAGLLTLGPLINTVTLDAPGAHAATPLGSTFSLGVDFWLGGAIVNARANGFATMRIGSTGVTYGYIPHGQYVSRVRLSDMVAFEGVTLPASATDILRTQAALATVRQEISVGMGDTEPYQVLQQAGQVTPPAADVWNPNASGVAARAFGKMSQVIGALYGQTIASQNLTGSITMRNPNWQTRDTIDDEEIRLNSLEMGGDLWVIGTSKGPYLYDYDVSRFVKIQREVPANDENCLRLAFWSPLGVIIPLVDGTRYQIGGSAESFGIEKFRRNTSPVQGRATAHAASTKWLYQALYNDTTGHTYLIAWRPAEPGDRHGNVATPYTIARFTSLRSDFLEYIGDVNGERTTPALIGGYGNDMFWMTLGRYAREIDDSSYRYAASGTAFLTEMRRYPEMIKDLIQVDLDTSNQAAARTIILAFAVDGGAANVLAGTYISGIVINGTINTDGHHYVRFIDDADPRAPLSWASGRRIKPEIRFATNVAATSPRVEGALRLTYAWRPLMSNIYRFPLLLEDDGVSTAEQQTTDLLALMGSGPVLVNEDFDQNSYFVRGISVEGEEIAYTGLMETLTRLDGRFELRQN